MTKPGLRSGLFDKHARRPWESFDLSTPWGRVCQANCFRHAANGLISGDCTHPFVAPKSASPKFALDCFPPRRSPGSLKRGMTMISVRGLQIVDRPKGSIIFWSCLSVARLKFQRLRTKR